MGKKEKGQMAAIEFPMGICQKCCCDFIYDFFLTGGVHYADRGGHR